MTRSRSFLLIASVLLALSALAADAPKAPPEWAMNASIIEACSCPMFCQCYFNDETSVHHDHASGKTEHYCKGNLAFKVNRGFYGDTKLDGALFWMAGDLGKNLSDGMEWGVVTFDPSVQSPQRDAIAAILSHVYPFPVKDFKIGKDAPIEWKANKDRAVAMLDAGKAGEIVLKRFQGETDEPVVIRNLKYIGAPRNDGFVLMPNEVEAYRLGDKAFEFHNTNGFMVTIDITSKDVLPKPAG
jgi:hypothetical protein